MSLKYVGLFAVVLAAMPCFAQLQTLLEDSKPLTAPNWHMLAIPVPGCAKANTTDPTFKNRFCYEAKHLVSPGALAWAAIGGGYSEWAPVPRGFDRDGSMFMNHMKYFYSRRAADGLGELIGGQLNREPIVAATSGQTGLWNRSRAAVLSVLRVRDGDSSRAALEPITGSLASGFMTMACCGYRHNVDLALGRSAETYAGYFVTALFREFKPDLKAYARRKFRRQASIGN